MHNPKKEMGCGQKFRGAARKQLGKEVTHGRKLTPGGLLHRKAQGFNEKARNDDGGKACNKAGKAPVAFHPLVVRHKAAPGAVAEAD